MQIPVPTLLVLIQTLGIRQNFALCSSCFRDTIQLRFCTVCGKEQTPRPVHSYRVRKEGFPDTDSKEFSCPQRTSHLPSNVRSIWRFVLPLQSKLSCFLHSFRRWIENIIFKFECRHQDCCETWLNESWSLSFDRKTEPRTTIWSYFIFRGSRSTKEEIIYYEQVAFYVVWANKFHHTVGIHNCYGCFFSSLPGQEFRTLKSERKPNSWW